MQKQMWLYVIKQTSLVINPQAYRNEMYIQNAKKVSDKIINIMLRKFQTSYVTLPPEVEG